MNHCRLLKGGQDGFAPGDAGAMMVQLQAAPHNPDGIGQRLDVAARVVTPVLGRAQSEPLHDTIQRMARSPRRAEEPAGKRDGIDGFDGAPGHAVLLAGALQKLGVEAMAVVGHSHRVADELGEPRQHLDGSRRFADRATPGGRGSCAA